MWLGDEGNPWVILVHTSMPANVAPETRDGKREPIYIYRDPRPSYLQGGGYVVAVDLFGCPPGRCGCDVTLTN